MIQFKAVIQNALGLLFVCGFLFSAHAYAADEVSAPLEVSAEVDRSIITIGDKIRYSVTVMYEKDLAVTMPNFVDSLGGFTVQDFGRDTAQKRGRTHRAETFWYVLDTYLVGAYIIPELEVSAVDAEEEKTYRMKTPEIFVEVRSVVGDGDEMNDIRGIKMPVLSAVNMTLILIVVGVIFGISGIAALVYFTRKYRQRIIPEVVLPPHVIALRALKRIAAEEFIYKGQVQEYYFQVSTCLRNYLEGRYGLKALEQTTEEFIEDVLDREVLNHEQAVLLSEFLQQCDYVKFAKFTPKKEEAQKAWDTVRQFVEETKDVEEGEA